VTDREMSQLITKRNVLRRRIDKWREIQNVYMPSITKHLAQSVSPDDKDRFFERPEAIPLYLPSTLPSDLISTIPSKFIEIKKCLRVSQADDSLNVTDRSWLVYLVFGTMISKHVQRPPLCTNSGFTN
jgi:hypothetical protein